MFNSSILQPSKYVSASTTRHNRIPNISIDISPYRYHFYDIPVLLNNKTGKIIEEDQSNQPQMRLLASNSLHYLPLIDCGSFYVIINPCHCSIDINVSFINHNPLTHLFFPLHSICLFKNVYRIHQQ